MKLAAVILAVATVVSSIPMEQHDRCGGLCTADYDPITCSNGVVYGNACELAKAKDVRCNPRAFDGVTCGSGIRE
ncbi:hypothetical protein MY10362_004522 [Beauveria mimosiformis]